MEEVALFHPPIVHFAVVLPLISTVMYLLYMKKGTPSLLKTTEYFIYAAVVFLGLGWYTGAHDGGLAYEALFMHSDEAVEELKEHKNLGMMLAIFFAGIAVMFKIAEKKANRYLNIIVAAALLFGSFAVLKQGKDGGELVYEYAANVSLPDSADGESYDEE